VAKLTVFDYARIDETGFFEAELQSPWRVTVIPDNEAFLYVVRHGECWLKTPDQAAPIHLRQGDIVSLVAGQPQTWQSASDGPRHITHSSFKAATITPHQSAHRPSPNATRLLVLTSSRDANTFIPVYPAVVVVPRSDRGTSSRIHWLVRMMEMEFIDDRPGKDAAIKRLAELVVIELVRFALPRLPVGGRNWLEGLTDKHIGQSIAIMHADMKHNWTLQKLASEVGMSRSVFVERFTKLVGEAPFSYLRRIRIYHAAQQLQSTKSAIIDIAEAVGYGSESAFNKAFVREMGVTPARYRSLHNGTDNQA
jgi:AraC-like DNA-binding protein